MMDKLRLESHWSEAMAKYKSLPVHAHPVLTGNDYSLVETLPILKK